MEAGDEDAVYERKKLELKVRLGGDMFGRGVNDTQLPDGRFPAPCPQVEYDREAVQREAHFANALHYERLISYAVAADTFTTRARHIVSATPEAYVTPRDSLGAPHMGPLEGVTHCEMEVYHRKLQELTAGAL